MEAKKTKLEKQFTEKAAGDSNHVKSQIFKGISIFVNGYTRMYNYNYINYNNKLSMILVCV